eukprot:8839205-Pyramimonas_sp.AAC.1
MKESRALKRLQEELDKQPSPKKKSTNWATQGRNGGALGAPKTLGKLECGPDKPSEPQSLSCLLAFPNPPVGP